MTGLLFTEQREEEELASQAEDFGSTGPSELHTSALEASSGATEGVRD